MIKRGTYVNQHVQPYTCAEFGEFSLQKNEPRNTKRAQRIKWFIMCIFNEAVPP